MNWIGQAYGHFRLTNSRMLYCSLKSIYHRMRRCIMTDRDKRYTCKMKRRRKKNNKNSSNPIVGSLMLSTVHIFTRFMRNISSLHGFSFRMKWGKNIRTIAIEMVIVIRADISAFGCWILVMCLMKQVSSLDGVRRLHIGFVSFVEKPKVSVFKRPHQISSCPDVHTIRQQRREKTTTTNWTTSLRTHEWMQTKPHKWVLCSSGYESNCCIITIDGHIRMNERIFG